MSNIGKWYHSTDEEHFDGGGCDTREEALDEARESYGYQGVVWTGQEAPPPIPTVSADRVIEDAQESAWEDADDLSDGWLCKVTPEQKNELSTALDTVFSDWMHLHKLEPKWFSVTDVREHEAVVLPCGCTGVKP